MLPLDTLLALSAFAFVTSVTPGPNNLMLLASGVNFGFARTVPHMLGVAIGFVVMVVLVGLGIGQVFAAVPALYMLLKVAGTLYMLYLAWKIANAGAIGEGRASGRPMTFLQAAAFQWVNPKAWAMAVSATATYTLPDHFIRGVVIVALVFGLINLPSVAVWALFGTWVKRLLAGERAVRVFNITMAVVLVASLWPAFAEWLR